MLTLADFLAAVADNSKIPSLARQLSEDILALAKEGTLAVTFDRTEPTYTIAHPSGIKVRLALPDDENMLNAYLFRAYTGKGSIDGGFTFLDDDVADIIDEALEKSEAAR